MKLDMFATDRNPLILALVSLAVLVIIGTVFLAVSQKFSGESLDSGGEVSQNKPAVLPSAGVTAASVRIFVTEKGFDKAEVRLKAGGTATFTNSGEQDHEIASTPHPTHTDYPDLNLGVLKPFESKTLTFPQAGTYKFHDHLNPSAVGVIVVE